MRTLILFLLFLPLGLNADEPAIEFNNHGGAFEVSSTVHPYHSTAFDGEVVVRGELVLQVVRDPFSNTLEGYRIRLIPEDPEVFPYVVEGFYAKPLTTVSLLNSDDILQMVFTPDELTSMAESDELFVSRRGYFTVRDYGTSVECDSRQYYGELAAFSPDTIELAYHSDREEMHGC